MEFLPFAIISKMLLYRLTRNSLTSFCGCRPCRCLRHPKTAHLIYFSETIFDKITRFLNFVKIFSKKAIIKIFILDALNLAEAGGLGGLAALRPLFALGREEGFGRGKRPFP